MIIDRPDDYLGPNLYVSLATILGMPLYLKCEGFNFAGSIKTRTARFLVEDAAASGKLQPGMTIVESSSGNLGVALAVIAASRGMRFICITDPRCSDYGIALMRATGAVVEVVTEADADGSYLACRKRRAAELCAENPTHIWLNQYENAANVRAHYATTARETLEQFPELDLLFVGAGTGGTLMGCARYLCERRPSARVVAVDSVGSVNLGGAPGPRHIPGLGSSQRMALIDETGVHDVEWVREVDTVQMCRRLARAGLVVGGSTGSVVEGARAWLSRHDQEGPLCAVTISPDFGGAYLATVYDDEWCAAHGLAVSTD